MLFKRCNRINIYLFLFPSFSDTLKYLKICLNKLGPYCIFWNIISGHINIVASDKYDLSDSNWDVNFIQLTFINHLNKYIMGIKYFNYPVWCCISSFSKYTWASLWQLVFWYFVFNVNMFLKWNVFHSIINFKGLGSTVYNIILFIMSNHVFHPLSIL